jgi:hypothetical protein
MEQYLFPHTKPVAILLIKQDRQAVELRVRSKSAQGSTNRKIVVAIILLRRVPRS